MRSAKSEKKKERRHRRQNGKATTKPREEKKEGEGRPNGQHRNRVFEAEVLPYCLALTSWARLEDRHLVIFISKDGGRHSWTQSMHVGWECPHFRRVPTASNSADGPSRLDFDLCIRLGAGTVLWWDGEVVECPLGVVMATPTYSKRSWKKGCFGLLSAFSMRVFDARLFFVLWRRIHRFVKFVPTIFLTQMAFMRTPERAWKPELESVLWFDWDRALSRRTVCLSFHKTTALACCALCLGRTFWKLLEDKQFSALVDDALSVNRFPVRSCTVV